MSNIVSQSQFARLIGVARSYITALKNAGRLVMVGNQVDVEASRARIAGTADPNRDDVAQRWAEQRPQAAAVDAGNAANSQDKIGNSYQAARAVKEKFAAMQAKLDYEKAVEKVVDKAAVDMRVEDRFQMFRQSLENLPPRIAPELVQRDLDFIRSLLKQEINAALQELAKSIKTIGQLGDDN